MCGYFLFEGGGMGLLDTARVGDGVERLLVVSEQLVNNFSALSGDFNPLHTNDEFAKSKGFPSRVVHGSILNLMISSIVGMSLNDDNVMLLSQRTSHKKPIFIDDIITAIGTIITISPSVRVIEMQLKFKNQNQILVAQGSCSLKCL
jgi:3-hydroxybutyryl-CoA dehydratase